MQVISVREIPDYQNQAIQFLQESWSEVPPIIYENCVENCIHASQDLPQWYLLETEGKIIGCAGLITNDFISRMDLYPWLCALFILPEYRGNNLATLLIEKAKADSKKFGFAHLNLCSDLIGYYEKLGFQYIGQGYHPWDEEIRIYQIAV